MVVALSILQDMVVMLSIPYLVKCSISCVYMYSMLRVVCLVVHVLQNDIHFYIQYSIIVLKMATKLSSLYRGNDVIMKKSLFQ